jgi:hypothetical protein
MDENTVTIIVLVLVFVMILIVPPFRIRRTSSALINRFRKMKALDETSAKTPEELGVRLSVGTPTLFGGGDPVQAAVGQLREANVIVLTNDGRLYLSEANLSRSKFNQRKSQEVK